MKENHDPRTPACPAVAHQSVPPLANRGLTDAFVRRQIEARLANELRDNQELVLLPRVWIG